MHKLLILLMLAVAALNVNVGNIQAAEAETTTPETKTSEQAAEAPKPPQKHLVAQGESLSTIATAEQLESWRPLWNANTNLQNPDQINPGEELIVPEGPTTDRPLPPGYGEPVAAAPVQQNTYQAPAQRRVVTGSAPNGDILSRIRMRESGGNYATNTGNGYYGAYQYDVGTWNNYGGYRYASDAPPAVQDAKAAETYAARGCSPWPNTCY